MRTPTDRQTLIDTTHAVDIGLGYSLALAVDSDGRTWPILWDQRQHAPQSVPLTPEDFRELTPHEMTGRLPAGYQQFYCGARASTGRPCRARVSAPGERCRHHPAAELTLPARTTTSEQLAIDLGTLRSHVVEDEGP